MVDTTDDTQNVLVIYLEGEAEVTCPTQRSHKDSPLVLAHRFPQTYLEERLCHQVGTGAQTAVNDFLTELQLLTQHLHFLGPIASKLGEIVTRSLEVEHRRSIATQIDFALLLLLNLCPLLDDVLLRKGPIIQCHLYRI